MRVVFMGTPEFAAKALEALVEAGYELPLVVTQPDRRAGRGNKLAFSDVKAKALQLGLEVYQPDRIRAPEVLERLREAAPEAIVVAAYGRILPPEILELPPLGCLNIHGSLLPAYRGAAPIQRALLDGQKVTGVTVMKMDAGMDTGDMLLQKVYLVPEAMDCGGLFEALAELGARALLEALPAWAQGRLEARPQPAEGVSYAPKLGREEERIDWKETAEKIRCRIRAFSPAPGANTLFNGKEIKILSAERATEREGSALEAGGAGAPAGTVLRLIKGKGPVVAAGEGALLLTQLRPPGKNAMSGDAYVNGYRLSPGQRFQ
ncbi:MAG: methionyl-tRNA formyltransferase [Peptococcaceae bacterium]|nr:methionyl-tRNA formyltransferase [Peptococcaceae bacterium]